jgi:hypothetical protein
MFLLNRIDPHNGSDMSYTYQQLCAEDVQTLKQLLKVFGEAFGDMDAYQSAVPSRCLFAVAAGETALYSLGRRS